MDDFDDWWSMVSPALDRMKRRQHTMNYYNVDNINYLHHLVSTVGSITISVDATLDLYIKKEENYVRISYMGLIDLYRNECTAEGIAKGLSMLNILKRKSSKELHQMMETKKKERGY